MKNFFIIASTFFMTCAFANQVAITRPLPKPDPRPTVEVVQWGGQEISLQVIRETRKGIVKITGNIQYSCARAYIDHIILDEKGGFIGHGKFTQHSGAYNPDHPPVSKPIHVMGYAHKGIMTLVQISDDDASTSESYVLKKGSNGNIHLCQ